MNTQTTSIDKAAIMQQFATIFGSTTMVLPTVMGNHEYSIDTLAGKVGVPTDVMRRALGVDTTDAADASFRVRLSQDEQHMLHTLGCYIQDRDAHATVRLSGVLDNVDSLVKELEQARKVSQGHWAQAQQQASKWLVTATELERMRERMAGLENVLECVQLERDLTRMGNKLHVGEIADLQRQLDALLCGRIKWMQHADFKVLSVRSALSDIWDEVKEFIESPSKDEASDVAFGIGRLIGACFGRKYVRVLGDGLHVAKCNERFSEYGHFRSKRALANG